MFAFGTAIAMNRAFLEPFKEEEQLQTITVVDCIADLNKNLGKIV